MKVATYNINGINRRRASLTRCLWEAQPDVVCLQEIKCRNDDFPRMALSAVGYEAVWNGQGAHHGVCILARDVLPIETRRGLPGLSWDHEARYIEAAVNGILFG